MPGFGLGSWGFLKFFFYKGKLNIDNISMKRWSLWSLYNKRFLLFFYKRFLLFFSAVLDECISDTCSVKLHCVKFSRSSNVSLLLDFSLSEESIWSHKNCKGIQMLFYCKLIAFTGFDWDRGKFLYSNWYGTLFWVCAENSVDNTQMV